MSRKAIAAAVAALIIVAIGAYSYHLQLTAPKLEGVIEADGSSTVFLITQAVAEEFMKINPSIRINVGISGTGGGFKRFVKGETEIQSASRPITPSEMELARKNGIEYLELKVAYDGIAVVVHPDNWWVDCLTIEELKRIWMPGSTVFKWKDVRPAWPDEPIRLYGPGTDSGTFDYFTEVVVGKAKASRTDYTASEDDHWLVLGVAGDRLSLGYFGYAYYAANADKLKIVPIDATGGPVEPTYETILGGRYPLSRPLFIYVNKAALRRPEVRSFVEYYLKNAFRIVAEVGYVPLPALEYEKGIELLIRCLEG